MRGAAGKPMHPFLRLALFLAPREYRVEYQDEILRDVQTRRLNVAHAAFDVARYGIILHLESLMQHLRFSLRSLAKSPLYFFVSVAVIALAIGANIAVASVLKNVLLDPLPYPHADRIVRINEDAVNVFSYPDARDFSERNRTLDAFGISATTSATLTGAGKPVNVNGLSVDAGYFTVFGARPELGRLFTPSDLGARRIVISDALWRSAFNANSDALRRTIRLDDVPYAVIGVAERGFSDLAFSGASLESAFWRPVDPKSNDAQRGYQQFNAWGLRHAGTSTAAVASDAARIIAQLVRAYPSMHTAMESTPAVTAIYDLIVGPVRVMIWLLYAAGVLLLLIACANVGNLALVRAMARERELTVRSALGASRGRIAGQLCSEAFVICGCGGATGLLLGSLGLRIFTAGSTVFPRLSGVHIDRFSIGYAVALVAVTTFVIGFLPVIWQRRDIGQALRESGRSGNLQRGTTRTRYSLVIAEIALAITVVTSAALIVRSFSALVHVPLGFDAHNVYSINTPNMPATRYKDYASSVRTTERIVTALRQTPDTIGVAVTTVIPFKDQFATSMPLPRDRSRHENINANAIGSGFFHTLRIPLLRGRDFDDRDQDHAQQVAIVNASFAQRYFGTINVLGKTINPGIRSGKNPTIRTIVGVVGDTRDSLAAPFQPEFYTPFTQIHVFSRIIVRTSENQAQLNTIAANIFHATDPLFAQPEIHSYGEFIAADARKLQLAAILFGILAVIALALALAGIYAITAYSVEQRTHEFGIRKAIGAQSSTILREVLSGAAQLGLAGTAIGLILAASSTHFLNSILFNVTALDAPTFASVVALLVACTLLAALVPALRATRIEPAVALRHE